MFNYVSFVRNLFPYDAHRKIQRILNRHLISSVNNERIVLQETFKMLMSQSSLRALDICPTPDLSLIQNVPFFTYPGAMGCLKNLLELKLTYTRIHHNPGVHPEFFHQLSTICHSIRSLCLSLTEVFSDVNGLTDLISVQQKLEYVSISFRHDCDTIKIIPSLTKLPNTLIGLDIELGEHYLPLSFISRLTNLQKLTLSFQYHDEHFKHL